ncbi:MAG: sugar phosphate isomerase [Lentisphaerae bacterium GWF2_45_14]|nr:MAG: sugar phosphate isomerase [Lentisphaerae bacterium GWF2_45_14]
MKAGISSYSVSRAIKEGKMDVMQAIEWIASIGAEHVEIVPSPFTVDMEMAGKIREKVSSLKMEISSYTIGASFVDKTEKEHRDEIERVKKEVDIANALGVKRMRHDVAYRKPEDSTLDNFEKDLPFIVKAAREIADYAVKYGIVTSIENHGYHVQHYSRVQRVIKEVDRKNFRTTIDIGNFSVVDIDPLVGVRKNAHLASMVHAKDFYLRKANMDPGEGFFKTAGENYCRGAIVGQGDIDIREALRILKNAGYDGYLSLEFEGREDCLEGSRIGFENLKKFLKEI